MQHSGMSLGSLGSIDMLIAPAEQEGGALHGAPAHGAPTAPALVKDEAWDAGSGPPSWLNAPAASIAALQMPGAGLPPLQAAGYGHSLTEPSPRAGLPFFNSRGASMSMRAGSSEEPLPSTPAAPAAPANLDAAQDSSLFRLASVALSAGPGTSARGGVGGVEAVAPNAGGTAFERVGPGGFGGSLLTGGASYMSMSGSIEGFLKTVVNESLPTAPNATSNGGRDQLASTLGAVAASASAPPAAVQQEQPRMRPPPPPPEVSGPAVGGRAEGTGAHVRERPEMQHKARCGQAHWASKVQEMRREWTGRWDSDAAFRDASYQAQVGMCTQQQIKSQHECLLRQLQLSRADGLIHALPFSDDTAGSFLGWTGFRVVPERAGEFRARVLALFPETPQQNTLHTTFRRTGLVPPRNKWPAGWEGAEPFVFDASVRKNYGEYSRN